MFLNCKMGNENKFGKFSHLLNLRVLYVLGTIIAVLILLDLSFFRYGGYGSILTPVYTGKVFGVGNHGYSSNGSVSSNAHADHGMVENGVNGNGFDKEVVFNSGEEGDERNHEAKLSDKGENGTSASIEENSELRDGLKSEEDLGIGREQELADSVNGGVSSSQVKDGDLESPSSEQVEDLVGDSDEEIDEEPEIDEELDTNSTRVEVDNQTSIESLQLTSSRSSASNNSEYLVADSGNTVSSYMSNMSLTHQHTNDKETENGSINSQSSHIRTEDSYLLPPAVVKKKKKKEKKKAISISQMNSMLLQNAAASNPVRPWRSSARDRELEKARVQIENAPVVRDVSQIHASTFRNISMFLRSYQLMERLLKVYIYREGEKPIFHQPYMRKIYASEGWFMKLMEANRQFVVKDAKKAHLFYVPFSSLKLRFSLNKPNFSSHQDLENYLDNYVDFIAKKYNFWNRTMGADHFLVACHDWAPGFTRNKLFPSIRALCNADVAKDFKIGKDVSVPVTNVLKPEHPMAYVGGSPPSERHILAFFAGSMHGYLRPVLLKYWSDKEPDMKIFGHLPRAVGSKSKYRAFMKSSRYCICAKGYQVHTPRVVESIHYGCVPVIISDNYVPPFFEILHWEAFSVFILEKDIPNLRRILLSISEEKYITMHQRIEAVRQHFLWHKKPQKYDIFHMILHSVWYNRLLQIKHG
ncbi:glycosyltransferase [Lithospermum erythrorhizon]|uniref:Glycosyltransferase n=1 Tax=Lithospermum erythrorhizon TaxID=34254 RepID=A0AAV3NXV9_LITER